MNHNIAHRTVLDGRGDGYIFLSYLGEKCPEKEKERERHHSREVTMAGAGNIFCTSYPHTTSVFKIGHSYAIGSVQETAADTFSWPPSVLILSFR